MIEAVLHEAKSHKNLLQLVEATLKKLARGRPSSVLSSSRAEATPRGLVLIVQLRLGANRRPNDNMLSAPRGA
jgi:hypothetical protein